MGTAKPDSLIMNTNHMGALAKAVTSQMSDNHHHFWTKYVFPMRIRRFYSIRSFVKLDREV